MRRPPFAVLVLPYRVDVDGELSCAVFRGASRRWHGLAGPGARGETPLEAARREAWRIAAIAPDAAYLALDSRRTERAGGVVQHMFAVRVCHDEVCPRGGRLEHHWVSYEIAAGLLHAEAEVDALWELRHRLGRPTTCI